MLQHHDIMMRKVNSLNFICFVLFRSMLQKQRVFFCNLYNSTFIDLSNYGIVALQIIHRNTGRLLSAFMQVLLLLSNVVIHHGKFAIDTKIFSCLYSFAYSSPAFENLVHHPLSIYCNSAIAFQSPCPTGPILASLLQ